MPNRNDETERGEQRAQEIEREYIEQTGHPSGGPGGGRGDQLQGDLPPSTDPESGQHSRKGQAQSPREQSPNEPPRKRVPGGRG